MIVWSCVIAALGDCNRVGEAVGVGRGGSRAAINMSWPTGSLQVGEGA